MQETPPFLDAHTHVQFPVYDADRGEVLARARAAGVKMVNVGTQAATSAAAIALAEQYPGEMWAAVAFHPAHASATEWHHDKNEQHEAALETFDIEKLRALARHPQVVAIGECGLDYFTRVKGETMRDAVKSAQREVFAAQIALAQELRKPLMVHCRNAFPDLIEILTAHHSPTPGIIHFFTGTPDDARALLDLGFSFTFGGVITFVRDYDAVIALIPPDRILSETDAPYVSPAPYRGKRNEPAYVVETVKKLAELKGMSADEMRAQIWANAQRIFRI